MLHWLRRYLCAVWGHAVSVYVDGPRCDRCGRGWPTDSEAFKPYPAPRYVQILRGNGWSDALILAVYPELGKYL